MCLLFQITDGIPEYTRTGVLPRDTLIMRGYEMQFIHVCKFIIIKIHNKIS